MLIIKLRLREDAIIADVSNSLIKIIPPPFTVFTASISLLKITMCQAANLQLDKAVDRACKKLVSRIKHTLPEAD
jgi:hypothetical protein